MSNKSQCPDPVDPTMSIDSPSIASTTGPGHQSYIIRRISRDSWIVRPIPDGEDPEKKILDKRVDKILRIIREAGSEGINRTKLIRSVGCSSEELDIHLSALEGKIEPTVHKGRTMSTRIYRLVSQ